MSGSIGDVFDGVHLAQTTLETPEPVTNASFDMTAFDETLRVFTSQVAGTISDETLQVNP
jgi:hypothetical protein